MRTFVFVILLVLASVFADSITSFGVAPTSVSPGGSITVSASLADVSGKPAAMFYRFGVATNKYWLVTPSKALSDGTGSFATSVQIPADFVERYISTGGTDVVNDKEKMVYPIKFEVLVNGGRKEALVNVINKKMTDVISGGICAKAVVLEQRSVNVLTLLARLMDSYPELYPSLVPSWKDLHGKVMAFREEAVKLKRLCTAVKDGPTLENLKELRDEYLTFGTSVDSLKKETQKVLAATEEAII